MPEISERPLNSGDARAVYEVMAAQQRAELGRVEIELADIVADWGRPSFDVTGSTWGIFDGDRLVGYSEYSGQGRGDASVHPDYLDRGLGTKLALWMQHKATANGALVVGMPVVQGGPGDALLASLGYFIRWTTWILQVPPGGAVLARDVPPGYALREVVEKDLPAVHAVVEDAFLEWAEREREPFEDFLAQTRGRPGFQPWMLRGVLSPMGEVVAVSCLVLSEAGEVYVDRLATRADHRNRGLAQALLVDSFRVGREHGATSAGLATDSRTGALDLYKSVGMVVINTWVHRAINLTG